MQTSQLPQIYSKPQPGILVRQTFGIKIQIAQAGLAPPPRNSFKPTTQDLLVKCFKDSFWTGNLHSPQSITEGTIQQNISPSLAC